jgi:hypothetical protein
MKMQKIVNGFFLARSGIFSFRLRATTPKNLPERMPRATTACDACIHQHSQATGNFARNISFSDGDIPRRKKFRVIS